MNNLVKTFIGNEQTNNQFRYDPVIGYGMAHYYDQRAMFHSSQLPFSQQTNSTMNSTLLESNVMAMDYGHVSIGNRQHYAHSECSNIRCINKSHLIVFKSSAFN